ncbi:iron complex transport system substrate-binding protein [Paenibacillus algorifonticola]|uniref:Iron complex transport system substrate-binding protein n=1 Tax=Paenibacillus algorifonticola TaxID=684063 RepID=A0A1I2HMN2_9BACL|nr:AraC family transcriptional regulator [Paenibacillus algorifonticola]SFF31374.1 iron complex transport system substrate-binding protein [Paenibacillus algorifonticola]
MSIEDHILLWNHAVVRMMDVRHIVMEFNEKLPAYYLPASTFLLTTRGSAKVSLDGNVSMVRRFHVLHGGKGTRLEIEAEDVFEFYLILYKASLVPPFRRELQLLMERENPFQQQYDFIPQYPVELLNKVKRMHREWSRLNTLEKLHAKSLFYQFVYELLWQIQRQGFETDSPDLSEQAIRYMTENYQHNITIESLAQLLNYSPQYLSRKFKDQTGNSPINFLIMLRMDKAQELLLTSDATLQEVAASVGYPDMFYFNRMFKKHVGIAPGQYKKRKLVSGKIQYSAKKSLTSSIVKRVAQRYIDDEDENHYQYKLEGDFTLYRGTKTSMTATLLLCLMLLLSACGTGGTNTTTATANGGSQSANVQPADAAQGGAAAGQQGSTNQASSAPTETTKTVSTVFGDVTIPVNPKRIVAIDYLGSLVALGANPIGSSEWLMQNPYLKDKIDGVENVGDSIEKVMEMEPDLIITLTSDQEKYELFSKIAPTVSVPYNKFSNVHEEINYFGELLGVQEKATAWLDDYDTRIAAAKAKVKQALPEDATVSVLEDQDKSIYVFGIISGRGGRAIYEALGLNPPVGLTEEIMKEKYYPISLEKLGDFAGDYVVLTSPKAMEEYKADPLWSQLDAIKNDRVFLWTEDQSWFQDPIAMLSQVEELANWLIEKSKS